jgi:hypothetical protein
LWRERREAAVNAFVDSLRKKADVKENWALLEQVKVDATLIDAGAPPAKAPELRKLPPQRSAK